MIRKGSLLIWVFWWFWMIFVSVKVWLVCMVMFVFIFWFWKLGILVMGFCRLLVSLIMFELIFNWSMLLFRIIGMKLSSVLNLWNLIVMELRLLFIGIGIWLLFCRFVGWLLLVIRIGLLRMLVMLFCLSVLRNVVNWLLLLSMLNWKVLVFESVFVWVVVVLIRLLMFWMKKLFLVSIV